MENPPENPVLVVSKCSWLKVGCNHLDVTGGASPGSGPAIVWQESGEPVVEAAHGGDVSGEDHDPNLWKIMIYLSPEGEAPACWV